MLRTRCANYNADELLCLEAWNGCCRTRDVSGNTEDWGIAQVCLVRREISRSSPFAIPPSRRAAGRFQRFTSISSPKLRRRARLDAGAEATSSPTSAPPSRIVSLTASRADCHSHQPYFGAVGGGVAGVVEI